MEKTFARPKKGERFHGNKRLQILAKIRESTNIFSSESFFQVLHSNTYLQRRPCLRLLCLVQRPYVHCHPTVLDEVSAKIIKLPMRQFRDKDVQNTTLTHMISHYTNRSFYLPR